MVAIGMKSSGISLHYEKHKGNDTAVNGLQRHNERKPGQKHSNKNIKDDRTAENVFLRQSPKKYKAEIEDKIMQNKKGGMKGVRKNNVRMVEATVQLSGTILEQPEEKQEEVLRDMYEWLKDEHGEDNIISAVIHKDETNMHLHFDFVPITEDGRLSARDIISKPNLKRMQSESLEYVKDKHPSMHFKRGGGETNGLSQKDFEAFKALQEDLERSMNEYSDALDEQEEELNEREGRLDKREESLNEREAGLSTREETIRNAHNSVYKREQNVSQWENALNAQETAYTAKLSRMDDKENELNEREDSLSEKAERLNEQQNAVSRQKIAVEAKEQEVDAKDHGADEKLLEAQNKLDMAITLREEAERMRESIAAEKEENSKLLREIKRFGDKFREMFDAVRNGTLRAETAERVADEFETPLDEPENLEHNIESINLVMDDLDDDQQIGLQR